MSIISCPHLSKILLLINVLVACFAFGQEVSLREKEVNSDKKLNVQGDVGLLAKGLFDINTDFKIGEHFTLGPSVILLSSLSERAYSYTAGGVGGTVSYYLKRAFEEDGFVFNLRLFYLHTKISECAEQNCSNGFGATGEEKNKYFLMVSPFIGYHWWFNKNFNLSLGVTQYRTYNQYVTLKNEEGQKIRYALPETSRFGSLRAGFTF